MIIIATNCRRVIKSSPITLDKRVRRQRHIMENTCFDITIVWKLKHSTSTSLEAVSVFCKPAAKFFASFLINSTRNYILGLGYRKALRRRPRHVQLTMADDSALIQTFSDLRVQVLNVRLSFLRYLISISQRRVWQCFSILLYYIVNLLPCSSPRVSPHVCNL